MDQSSSNLGEEALLLGGETENLKKKSAFVLLVKWMLKIIMWLIFISWVALMFFHPTQFGDDFFNKLAKATSQTLWGPSGGTFILMSGPILLIALLSIPYLILNGDDEELKKLSKKPRIGLWTFPVLVDGVFGVVSAAELIGILLFYFYVVWAICTNALRNLSLLPGLDLTPREQRIAMLELCGTGIGETGLFCMTFLFLPVARGSLLLRLINIPFDHAVRYHIWLGHLIMFIFTLHGLCYIIGWAMQGWLHYEILEWKEVGIANFAGVMALIIGLVIWVTSLPLVRKWNFEVFFYTHQLYVVFVILLAVHVSDYYFSMAAAGIFLFMLDRLLRFCQSRKSVDVISANSLPCGTMELLLSRPKKLRYNALSFVFVQIGEVSKLQWHPFSVSSSPLDGKNHISILIKNLGNWTQKVSKSITKICEEIPNSKLVTASIEGPYGHEVAYYLMYKNLILVAGGIGISPFLAILKDIFHRARIHGERSSPYNILVIWAIKNSREIPLLSPINMDSISPNFFLNIHIYVTRETNSLPEEGTIDYQETKNVYVRSNYNNSSKGNGSISDLVGTGDITWCGTYVMLCTLGFMIILGLLDVFYINPYRIKSVAYKGFLFFACLVATVFIFGGFVVCLWHIWERKISLEDDENEINNYQEAFEGNEEVADNNLYKFNCSSYTVIEYGSRPNFKEIFGSVSKEWGNVDVGVIVCGPSSLESSVAKEIRSSTLRREFNHPIFHFHSHSFNL